MSFLSFQPGDGEGDQFLFATNRIVFRRVFPPGRVEGLNRRLEAEAKDGIDPGALAEAWQTDGSWLGGPTAAREELRGLLQEAIDHYLVALFNSGAPVVGARALPPDFRHRLDLWGWAGGSQTESNNPPHVHRNAQLSGIYYLRGLRPGAYDPQDLSGCVVFVLSEGAEEVVLGSYAAPSNLPVHPVEGTLLLFPSYLRHYVNRYKFSTFERVYVAFNCCFETPAEVMADPSRRR